jgi:hypothetical protein
MTAMFDERMRAIAAGIEVAGAMAVVDAEPEGIAGRRLAVGTFGAHQQLIEATFCFGCRAI